MSFAIVLPALGESVSEATITRWLKEEGDPVSVGEPIVEVSTDKVDSEVAATVAGTLQTIVVSEGVTVEVGNVLAMIATSDDDSVPAANPSAMQAVHHDETATPATTAPDVAPRPRILSPLVRSLAREKGIDTRGIRGSGHGGRIRKSDILALVSDTAALPGAHAGEEAGRGTAPMTPTDAGTIPMSRLRRTIAQRAVQSLLTTAQLTTVLEVDVTGIDAIRQRERDSFVQRTGVKLSLLPYFAVAATRALREFPIINSRIEGDTIVLPERENINIAVDTEKGLYSPVVKNASDLDVEGFAIGIHSVSDRARSGQLTADDLTGGTFTITNTGSRGAMFDTPIVFLPQVATLGVGVVTRRPVVVFDGLREGIGIRSMVHLALSYDHRVIDGADASRYLTAIKRYLEPENFTV